VLAAVLLAILPETITPFDAHLQPHQYLLHRQLEADLNTTLSRRPLEIAPIANLAIMILKQQAWCHTL
jgi:hypothetical protein